MVLYGNDRSAGAFWVPCTVFFIGTTTLVSNILYMQVLEQVGMPFNLDGMILVLIAIFFPVGYSYWGSVVCAVVTFIVMLVAIPVFLPEGYLDDFIALSIYPWSPWSSPACRATSRNPPRAASSSPARRSELADSDSLTGLFNRRMFEILLERALLESQRERHCLGLMLVDVDYFKAYNDRYGHPMGDAALQAVAALGALPRRSLDIAARLGARSSPWCSATWCRTSPPAPPNACASVSRPWASPRGLAGFRRADGEHRRGPERAGRHPRQPLRADEALYRSRAKAATA